MILTAKIEVDAREGKMKIRQDEFLLDLEQKLQSRSEPVKEDEMESSSYLDIPERYHSEWKYKIR